MILNFKPFAELTNKAKTGLVSRFVLLTAATAGLMVMGVHSFSLTAEPQATNNASRALPVRTANVKLENGYFAHRSFTGRVLASQVSPLAFELSGTLSKVYVDLGSAVKKGDTLAELDTARLLARQQELEAELEEIRANLKLAERTLARAEKTFKQGHASAQRLDEAEANAISLRAREHRLNASLASLTVELEKSIILAPYSGVITSRDRDLGSVVGAGIPVIELTETGPLEAHIGMPPAHAQAIKNGSPFILLNGQRKKIDGATVRKIVPVITGQTRTMMVTFDVPEGSVARGELVNAVVRDWQEQSGAWLPLRSLTADVRGLWRVYKVVDSDTNPHVQFENVQILYTEDNKVFVNGTLSNNDIIIADGIDRLAPGQRVEMLTLTSR